MMRVIDFHTHILPKIDDGSSSVRESVKLLRMEAAQGISHVVATPHFYANHDSPERFLKRRRRAEERLWEEISDRPDLPEISVGAEIYFYEGMSESDSLPELAIEGTGCVMVEMPSPPWSDRMYQELYDIYRKQELTPIIAHVDRYIRPFKTYRIPERLADLPVLVQANGSFFNSRATAGMAVRMLKKGQIHLLGSDCHNIQSRKPNLDDALQVIERRLGTEAIERINTLENELFSNGD